MAFANQISVPVRNFDYKVPGAVWYALTAQATIGCKARRKGQLLVFSFTHLGDTLETFSHDAMACRAGTDAATGMIDLDPVS